MKRICSVGIIFGVSIDNVDAFYSPSRSHSLRSKILGLSDIISFALMIEIYFVDFILCIRVSLR